MAKAGSSGQPPAAEALISILAHDYHLARTSAGEPFAVRLDTPSVMIPLHGKHGLRHRLTLDLFRATGRLAPGNALADVMGLAEGSAMARPGVTPSLRIAAHAGALYLDLGRRDGWAVELVPGAWRVVQRPPVVFARTSLTAELPLPDERGQLGDTRDLISITGDDQWALYVACRIASLFPGITHPIELVTGPAGSAKTSTTRLTADWIDPAPAMTPVPRDGRTWAAIGASRYTQPVDNVSWIAPWWSDLLCKAASGDGWVDRALYTDGGVYVAAFQSCVILNGISLGALRGDLADRVAAHTLVRRVELRSDDELAARWRAAWPGALGWLLDRAAETYADMAHLPNPVSTDRLVRFAQIVELTDRRWHTRALDCWRSGRADVLEDVADADLVAVAIRKAIHAPEEMTASELLSRLEMAGLPAGKSPWTPKTLSEHVERVSGALASLGWGVGRKRDGRSRRWCFTPPGC